MADSARMKLPCLQGFWDLSFYNYLGQIEYFSGYPLSESFGDWSQSTGESLLS
jgi:hypothetical protein